MDERSARDFKAELIALADAFLQNLNERSHAARRRVYAGVPPSYLQPQIQPESMTPRVSEDPVFATRELDFPDDLAGLLNQSILGD